MPKRMSDERYAEYVCWTADPVVNPLPSGFEKKALTLDLWEAFQAERAVAERLTKALRNIAGLETLDMEPPYRNAPKSDLLREAKRIATEAMADDAD